MKINISIFARSMGVLFSHTNTHTLDLWISMCSFEITHIQHRFQRKSLLYVSIFFISFPNKWPNLSNITIIETSFTPKIHIYFFFKFHISTFGACGNKTRPLCPNLHRSPSCPTELWRQDVDPSWPQHSCLSPSGFLRERFDADDLDSWVFLVKFDG